MGAKVILMLAFLVILVQGMTEEEQPPSDPTPVYIQPLSQLTMTPHSRAKRQARGRYPVPVIVGGGGYPGRGVGGIGIPGRGIGGRGIGGRGVGGRGIGGRGIGGRGGFGGGRGGRG